MKKTAIIVSFVLGLLLMRAEAQSVSDFLQEGLSMKHALIPLYPTGSVQLSALVRVDRSYIDYQHRGFFRIGLFPVIVLEGVTIEAKDRANPLASLDTIRHWVKTKAGQRLEMHEVKFIFSPTNRVEAGLVRCVADDRWELLKGVHLTSGAEETRASQAILQIAGPRAGEIIFDTSPRSTKNFLASNVVLPDNAHSSK